MTRAIINYVLEKPAPETLNLVCFTTDPRVFLNWVDPDNGFFDAYNQPEHLKYYQMQHMAQALYTALGAIYAWIYKWELPIITPNANGTPPMLINCMICDVNYVKVAEGTITIDANSNEINTAIPLGISNDDFLDTILATVSGVSGGSNTGIETFFGILGDQRVQSTIDPAGNRTQVQYGP